MGFRGPAPKSRDRKILEGTFRRDRDTGPTMAPPPLTKKPSPPAWLSDAGKKEWRRIVAELMTLGVLSAVALKTLEGYCAAYARAIRAEEDLSKAPSLTVVANQGEIPHPAINIAKAAWAEMRSFATKLGLSPADHTRVKVNERKADNTKDPWAGIANG